MAKSDDTTIDMTALVSSYLSGSKGFASTKRMRKMGAEGYANWLAEKLAQKAASQINDPKRKKRVSKSV